MREVRKRLKEVDLYEHIKEDINLSPSGMGLCPFHEDHNPSFHVSRDTNTWRCYGACSTGGDIVDYEAKKRKISIRKAIILLCKKYNIPYDEENTLEESKERKKEEEERRALTTIANIAHQNLINPQTLNQVQARKYLVQRRWIFPSTIRNHRIGYLDYSTCEKKLKEILGTEILVDLGLARINKNGKLIYRCVNHLVFPCFLKGEVTYLVLRNLDSGENSGEYPKYLNLSKQVTQLYNEDILSKSSEVYITEGIIDCLTMLQAGYPSVSMLGVNSQLRETTLSKLKEKEKIYILFDRDEAGMKGAKKLLYLLEGDALMLSLPEGAKDVNDKYALIGEEIRDYHGKIGEEQKDELNKRFRNIIEALKEEAIDLPQLIADEICGEKNPEITQKKKLATLLKQNPNLLNNLPFLDTLKSKLSEHPFSKINRQSYNTIITEIKKEMKEKDKRKEKEGLPLEEEQIDLTTKLDIYRPSLDYSEDRGIVVIHQTQQLVKVDEDGRKYYEIKTLPYIVTSDRNLCPAVSPGEIYHKLKIVLLEKDLNNLVCLNGHSPVWPNDLLRRFLSGEDDYREGMGIALFVELQLTLKNYLEMREELHYIILSLWSMGTYLYPLFDSYPYLLLIGEKESGKTRTLTLLKQLAYNFIMSTSITPAALFRTLEIGCTFGYDEAENLGNRKVNEYMPEIQQILNSGYKKGLEVIRMEGETTKTQRSFRVYGPKVIASIAMPSDTLLSRCIPISMLRAGQHTIQARRRIREDDPQWGKLRHQQFLFSFCKFRDVRRHYHTILDESLPIYGRSLELWAPLLSILRTLREEAKSPKQRQSLKTIEERILKFAKEIHQRNASPEEKVCIFLLALKEHFEEIKEKEVSYTPTELVNLVHEYLELASSGLSESKLSREEQYTTRWVTNVLNRYNLYTSKRRVTSGEGTRKGRESYTIPRERVEDVISRYNLLSSPDSSTQQKEEEKIAWSPPMGEYDEEV